MNLFELLVLVFLGGLIAGICSEHGIFFIILGAIAGFTFFTVLALFLDLKRRKNIINENIYTILFAIVVFMFCVLYVNHIIFYSNDYINSIWGLRQIILDYYYAVIIYFYLYIKLL